MRKGISIQPSITDRSDESINRFFKEISKIPLLTPEEEVELSNRIKKGDEKALNKLVESNLRFVVSVAKKYQGKGLPLVDLIQAGSMGLIEAAKAFDASRGFKFISFAVWYIRQYIFKTLNEESRMIRPSFKQIVNAGKINRSIEKLSQENSRDPSINEIEEDCDLDSNSVYSALASTYYTSSLEGNEEDAGPIDVIENTIDRPEEEIERKEYKEEILNILSNLSPREHDIVILTFGIGVNSMTSTDIADMFGLTTIRVGQILREALDKLKQYKELKLLL